MGSPVTRTPGKPSTSSHGRGRLPGHTGSRSRAGSWETGTQVVGHSSQRGFVGRYQLRCGLQRWGFGTRTWPSESGSKRGQAEQALTQEASALAEGLGSRRDGEGGGRIHQRCGEAKAEGNGPGCRAALQVRSGPFCHWPARAVAALLPPSYIQSLSTLYYFFTISLQLTVYVVTKHPIF